MIRTLCAGLLFGPYAGCLVNDEIMFEEEPDFPPVILDAPNPVAPIGEHIWIDSSVTAMWPLDVRVRDENINQELIAHWRVLGEGETLEDFDQVILAPGLLVRDLQISVNSARSLDRGSCHRLELAVSGSFFKNQKRREVFDVRPDDAQEDIDTAVWWIWEGRGEMLTDDQQKARLIDSCNAIEALLASDPMAEDM